MARSDTPTASPTRLDRSCRLRGHEACTALWRGAALCCLLAMGCATTPGGTSTSAKASLSASRLFAKRDAAASSASKAAAADTDKTATPAATGPATSTSTTVAKVDASAASPAAASPSPGTSKVTDQQNPPVSVVAAENSSKTDATTDAKSAAPLVGSTGATGTSGTTTAVAAASGDKPAELPANPFAVAAPRADRDAAPGAARRPNEGTAVVWSGETLALISSELRDATPEERAYWYDQLKRVEPGVIPDILRARRMSLHLTAQAGSGVQLDPELEAIGGSGVVPAGAESDPATSATGRVQLAHREVSADAPNWAQTAHYSETIDPSQPAHGLTVQPAQYVAEPTATSRDGVPAPFPTGRVSDPRGQVVARRAPYPDEVAAAPAAPPVSPGQSWPAAPPPPVVTPRSGNSVTRFLPGFSNIVPASSQQAATRPVPVVPADVAELQLPDRAAQLDRLIAHCEREIAELPVGETPADQLAYVRQQVYLRMLYLMADHPERAMTAIPGIPLADQEFWQQTMWAMANYFDDRHLPTSEARAAQTIAQLGGALRKLREQANLEIRNVTFCRQNLGYGVYERFPRDEFRPGEEVLLYAEVDNFSSEITSDGQYRTLLRSTLEILSPAGEVRWQKDFAPTEDLCRSTRRDYYHNYQFVIPERNPLGPHTLKVTVYDELSQKVASASVNFVVR